MCEYFLRLVLKDKFALAYGIHLVGKGENKVKAVFNNKNGITVLCEFL